jgi:hypothetical protein|tara:strand:- start:1939 stop:2682 length:744 start_codon:yes stop_codon:yes gene_type:complete
MMNLPPFGYVDININIDKFKEYCEQEKLIDPILYDNINVKMVEGDHQGGVISKHFDSAQRNKFRQGKDFVSPNKSYGDASYKQAEKYKQLHLTEFDISKKSDIVSSNMVGSATRVSPESDDYIPEADEYNYGIKNFLVKGEIKTLLNKFIAPLARVRFACLMPGFSINPHIDYDPYYITRFHIPIITNKDCMMCTVEGNAHFPADGRAYFFNTGLKHWAENNSKFPRIHLIVDLQSTDDLVNLKKMY